MRVPAVPSRASRAHPLTFCPKSTICPPRTRRTASAGRSWVRRTGGAGDATSCPSGRSGTTTGRHSPGSPHARGRASRPRSGPARWAEEAVLHEAVAWRPTIRAAACPPRSRAARAGRCDGPTGPLHGTDRPGRATIRRTPRRSARCATPGRIDPVTSRSAPADGARTACSPGVSSASPTRFPVQVRLVEPVRRMKRRARATASGAREEVRSQCVGLVAALRQGFVLLRLDPAGCPGGRLEQAVLPPGRLRPGAPSGLGTRPGPATRPAPCSSPPGSGLARGRIPPTSPGRCSSADRREGSRSRTRAALQPLEAAARRGAGQAAPRPIGRCRCSTRSTRGRVSGTDRSPPPSAHPPAIRV